MHIDRSYPRLLLITLCVALAVTLFMMAGSSSASLGTYNTQWDGTAEIRAVADDAEAETTIIQNTSRYAQPPPNETVAVVLSPTETYADSEIGAVRSFVRSGGTLLVAEDYGDGGNELLSAVGADARIDQRPLRDERRAGPSPAFPRATPVANHTYLAGVEGLMLNHGSVVNPGSATTLVRSSEFSYLDQNQNNALDDEEELSSWPVVTIEEVGAGTVVVVSDPSIFLNSMLDRSDNAALLENIVGTHQTVLIDVSHSTALPPLVALRFLFQQSGIAAFVGGCMSLLALGVVLKPLDIANRLRAWETDKTTPPTISSDDISAAVRRRHPDWDEERVDRVTDRLMKHKQRDNYNE